MKSLFFAGLLSLLLSPCFSCAANVLVTQTHVHHEHHMRMRNKVLHSALPVDINHADATQLTTLKGIGAKRAASILAYRNTHGSFKTMAELGKVKGIGSKEMLRLQANNPGRIILGLTTITKLQV